MADYMALFHNPESFEDSDLSSMRNKIRMHKFFVLASVAGFAAIPTLRGQVNCHMRNSGYGLVGLLFGSTFVNNMMGNSSVNASKYSQGVQDTIDLNHKFNERWVALTLNATGYGNNALTAQSHTMHVDARYKKPY